MSKRSAIIITLVMLAAMFFHDASQAARSMWLPPIEGASISYELVKIQREIDPRFEVYGAGTAVDVSFWSSASFVSGRVTISEGSYFAFDLPFAHVGGEPVDEVYVGTGATVSQTTIGNPYIGVETWSGDHRFIEFGCRLPFTSKSGETSGARGWGASSDWQRLEAFLPEVLAPQLVYNYRRVFAGGGALWARGGPTVWISTAGDFANSELLLDFGVMGGYAERRFELLGGVSGRIFATGNAMDLAERTITFLGVTGSAALGRFHPGAAIKLPLDELLAEEVSFYWTLDLTVHLDD